MVKAADLIHINYKEAMDMRVVHLFSIEETGLSQSSTITLWSV